MTYHSNEELEAAIDAGAARAGSRAAVRTVGQTVGGRPIRALTVAGPGRTPTPARPQALVTANVHGTEVIASEVALAVLELLSAPDPIGRAAELLALADATVVPAVNLDSRAVAVRAARSPWPVSKAPRGNARGVDLNRNFPYPRGAKDVWYPLSGTTVSWLPWYRGPEALSEPEARALAELAAELRPAAAVNLHSMGRFFLYPYCYTATEPADLPAFLAMGEAFVAAQPTWRYRIKQSRSWYAILGDLDDWLYDTLGTLSVTVEVSRNLEGVGLDPRRLFHPFFLMNPRDPAAVVANDAGACLAALSEGCRQRSARTDR